MCERERVCVCVRESVCVCERERACVCVRERERERRDNTLLHRDKDLSTCRLFCKSVPDDNHSKRERERVYVF